MFIDITSIEIFYKVILFRDFFMHKTVQNLINIQNSIKSKIIELEYCDLENVEIKNWFNISFTIGYNILDVYYNGKLKKSKILNGIPKINKNILYASYNKGFHGFMKKLQIIPKKVNPNVISRIYQLN